MEKNLKRFKTLAVVLIVILISAIAFGGLYLKRQGIWENVLQKFSYGMELEGVRELRFVLDTTEEEKNVYVDSEGNYAGDVVEDDETQGSTEISLVDDAGNPINQENTAESAEADKKQENVDNELANYKKETRTIKANEDADINISNFEKTKKIIQERLETINQYEYNIRLDNVTGELVVEVPDNDNVEMEQALISTKGKFEVIDYQNGLILLNNSDISEVSPTVQNLENGYQSFLAIKFNKEGTEKLKEISNKYVSTTAEDGTLTQKCVSMKLDGQVLLETYFGEELPNGILLVPMGQATTVQEQLELINESTTRIARLLNSEMLPLTYKLNSDTYIQSYVSEDVRLIAIASFAIIVLILSIVMIVKYKVNGLKFAIMNVGYIAILTLILRYTNVLITINSLIAFVCMVGINILFIYKLLENLNKNDDVKLVFYETMKQLYLALVPVCIITLVFTFMPGAIISSIGMVLFWGLATQAVCSEILYLMGII